MISNFLRALIVLALGVSSLSHLENTLRFVGQIDAYDLTPPILSIIIATGLPILELVVAFSLCTKQLSCAASIIATMMFFVFLAAQSIAIIRGIEIGCGCFGDLSADIGLKSISLTCFLLLSAGFIFWNEITPNEVGNENIKKS